MAKPGSDAARALSRGKDLRGLRLGDEQAVRRQELLELRLGLRCSGCFRRIGVGFHFTSLDPRADEPVLRLSACTRPDCDFAEKAREGATLIEAVEYAWVDPAGLGARPARVRGVQPVQAAD